jgi:hypothetical protein
VLGLDYATRLVGIMAKVTATQRSLHYFRQQGYVCAVVERWNMYAKIRQDLFGFCDFIAYNEKLVLFVQSTVMSGKQEHMRKMLANKHAAAIAKGPARAVVLICWRKLKVKRGGKATTWEADITVLPTQAFLDYERQLETTEETA